LISNRLYASIDLFNKIIATVNKFMRKGDLFLNPFSIFAGRGFLVPEEQGYFINSNLCYDKISVTPGPVADPGHPDSGPHRGPNVKRRT
jgi:hypothetical protein